MSHLSSSPTITRVQWVHCKHFPPTKGSKITGKLYSGKNHYTLALKGLQAGIQHTAHETPYMELYTVELILGAVPVTIHPIKSTRAPKKQISYIAIAHHQRLGSKKPDTSQQDPRLNVLLGEGHRKS